MQLPSEREMDVLLATGEQQTIALTAIALHALNVPAVSLTGPQAASSPTWFTPRPGFKHHAEESPRAFESGQRRHRRPVSRARRRQGQITTLGRGGSDLTAIALAAALKADLCQIYTDVCYTPTRASCRPRRSCRKISYDEMLELASLGAKVMPEPFG